MLWCITGRANKPEDCPPVAAGVLRSGGMLCLTDKMIELSKSGVADVSGSVRHRVQRQSTVIAVHFIGAN